MRGSDMRGSTVLASPQFGKPWKTWIPCINSEVPFRAFMDYPHEFHGPLLPMLSWYSRQNSLLPWKTFHEFSMEIPWLNIF